MRPPRAVWLVLLAVCCLAPAAVLAIDLRAIAERARALALSDYEDSRVVPEWLLGVTYDEFRDIRFRPDRALWRKTPSPFEVQFFHPGLFYDRTVRVHEVDEKGVVRDVPFSPDAFDYGRNTFASRVPQDLGFAGFRLHYPINRRDYKDEVVVFLGATYLRGVARGQGFGLSARGLAIDTGLPSGEEFPWFREFWLERPRARARTAVIYALLDSRRVTGAYRFEVVPGAQTVVTVAAQLFFRKPVAKLGLAPITSMFYAGENGGPERRDYRPEVHDSDGLLIADATGTSWRPLSNPSRLRISSFEAPQVKGFGLMQRDRTFDHYQDFETREDRRPSAWVQPLLGWPAGRIELTEIPTPSEQNDNVVAFWNVQRPADSLQPLAFSYALRFLGGEPAAMPLARVAATRVAAGSSDGAIRYLLDFEGAELAKIPADRVVEGVVAIDPPSAGAVLDQQLTKNPVTGGWRLVFQLQLEDAGRVRAQLRERANVLTERWIDEVAP
jgi:glucans biosynthesis protein